MNSNESLRRVKDKKSETLNSVLLLEEVKTRVRRPVPIKCERGARKTFSSRIACDPYVECVPRGRNFVNRQSGQFLYDGQSFFGEGKSNSLPYYKVSNILSDLLK